VIRVLLVDDHALVRRGLFELLAGEPDIEVAGEAANAEEALAILTKVCADVVLLDLSLPGRGGFDLLAEIRRSQPAVRTIVLSGHDAVQSGVRAIRVGAAGFVSKGGKSSEVLTAIRSVAHSGQYISPELATALADFAQLNRSGVAHHDLSGRELEVFRQLTAGRTVSEIAHDMSLSVKTVGTYETRILQKLGVRTTGELIHYAIDHRLFG
jgi:two-component system, NarL family, invasion response regulator UvrY